MPSGEMRRPPQLWEQRLARTTSLLGVGLSSSGDGTAIVTPSPPPGSGGGTEPAPVLPPPGDFIKPSTPTLVGAVQGIRVQWDGLNSAGDLWPYDTSWIEVHMDTSGTAFTPGTATLRGRLDYPGEFYVGGLTAGTTYYFRLRGADPQGNFTEPSDAASGQTGLTTSSDYGTATIDAGAVSFDARTIGGVTNTVGAVAPSSPLLNDVWLDSSPGTAIIHKIWNGSTWVTNAWGSASIAAGQVTALQVAAGAITAGAIAAGAVTADKITADAIDGKTITGATIRTSSGTGARVVLDTSGIRGFNASNQERFNLNASTGTLTMTGGTVSSGLISGGTVSGGFITGGTVEGSRFQTSGGLSRIRLDDNIPFPDGPVGGVDGIEFFDADVSKALVRHNGVDGLQFYADDVKIAARNGFNGVDVNLDGNLVTRGQFSVNTTGVASFRATGTQVFSDAIDTNTTANAANVRVGASAQLLKSTSTQRVKDHIISLAGDLTGVNPAKVSDEPASADPYDVLDIAPVEFQSLAPTDGGQRLLGFIAENVAEVFPWAAEWDDGGEPSSVADRPILAALLAVVKQQQATITDLRTRIEALEA